MKNTLILMLAGMIMMGGCAGEKTYKETDLYAAYYMGYEDGQKEITDWKIFSDYSGTKIILPGDWSFGHSSDAGSFYRSTKDSTYVVVSESFNTTIDDYISDTINYYKNNTSTFNIVTNTPIIQHGVAGKIIEYTWQDILNGLTEAPRYTKQLVLRKQDTVYVISFFSLQSDKMQNTTIIDRILFSVNIP